MLLGRRKKKSILIADKGVVEWKYTTFGKLPIAKH